MIGRNFGAWQPVTMQNSYRITTTAMFAPLWLLWFVTSDFGTQEPWYTLNTCFLFALVGIGIALVLPALFVSFRQTRDWRLALPGWFFTAASALALVNLLLAKPGVDLWTPVLWLVMASLLSAAWVGWFVKLPERTPKA